MLKEIEIKNKGLNLKIEDFKRINLFVGDNNVGKTRVLDSIREKAFLLKPSGILEKENSFTILKSLNLSFNNILTIENIGYDIHKYHRHMMWDFMLNYCLANDFQLFATTNAYGIIKSLSKVYKEFSKFYECQDWGGEDNLRLFRLYKKEETGETKYKKYNTEDLSISLEKELDVRGN
jgi:AAA15 family ATPase/GTPase